MNDRRRSWIIALALLLIGAAIAAVARGAGPLPGDLGLAQAIQAIGGFETPLGGLLNLIGQAIWPLVGIVLIVALALRRWSTALLFVAGGAGGFLIGEFVLKPLVARPRPSSDLVRVLDPSSSFSFPSSTSLVAAIMAGLIVGLLPRRKGLALGIGLVVVLLAGIARIYVGEHWPTDIAASWCFAGAWLLLLRNVWSSWPSLSQEASRR